MSDTTLNGVASALPNQATASLAGASDSSAALGTTSSSTSTASGLSDLFYPGSGSGMGSNSLLNLFNQVAQMLMAMMQQLIGLRMGGFSGQTGGVCGTPGTVDPSAGAPGSTPTDPSGTGTKPAGPGVDAGGIDPVAPEDPTEETKPTDDKPVDDKLDGKMNLQAVVDEKGQTTILTEDGYKICCEGKDQAWTITGPDGKTTRIWGDPHVHESDGDDWSFYDQSSFVFGNNKITVQTVPYNGNDKVTLTGTIHIYNGDERVTITDIDKNKPTITAVAGDGHVHDASLSDGTTYVLGHEEGSTDEEWKKQDPATSSSAAA